MVLDRSQQVVSKIPAIDKWAAAENGVSNEAETDYIQYMQMLGLGMTSGQNHPPFVGVTHGAQPHASTHVYLKKDR